MNFKTLIGIIALVLIINNCGSDEWKVGPEEVLHISVSKGLNPTYSWEEGLAHRLIVLRDSNIIVWGIHTPSTNKINSPVTHGKIQNGAELYFDWEPIDSSAYDSCLVQGKSYYVQVIKWGKDAIGAEIFMADSTEL